MTPTAAWGNAYGLESHPSSGSCSRHRSKDTQGIKIACYGRALCRACSRQSFPSLSLSAVAALKNVVLIPVPLPQTHCQAGRPCFAKMEILFTYVTAFPPA